MKDDQRVALTKRLLKEGLLRLMEKKSIHKISISELCAEAGINRSTFYRYYNLPKDLLLDIEREVMEGIHMDSWEIRNMRDIVHYCERILTYMEQNAPILKVLMRNNSDEHLTRMLNTFCDLAFRLKLPILPVQEMDEESLRLCSAYTVGGIFCLMREWLLQEVPKTAQEVSALVLKCIDSGVQLYNTP